MPLLSLTLQDGWPRYRDASGTDSCCRKPLCTATATFSISHSTLTAPARLSRGRGPWGAGLDTLVSAGLGDGSGPGAREAPGAWVVLSEESPAGHEEPKAEVGPSLGTAPRAWPVGPAWRGKGDWPTGARGTLRAPQQRTPGLHVPQPEQLGLARPAEGHQEPERRGTRRPLTLPKAHAAQVQSPSSRDELAALGPLGRGSETVDDVHS